ncbi:Rossmann-fold superfamily protein [Perilla frutescens var. hirtella]|nr:Rossmann-fold superfamily protein [Perilla frutescens var. frutescens]KAH6783301.1 Rossmann-fold superfamily protein [Perilla frutescens var. hirtella]
MWFFEREGASGFSGSSTAEQVTQGIDGTNLTAIVTGASSGIGVETTRVLALRGVRVIMAVRNVDAGRKAKEVMIKEIPAAKIDVMELDLSSFESIRKFASEFLALSIPLNILINNAGVLVSEFLLSKDNIELQFATNHLGHFLLTNLLLDAMKTTATQSNIEGRIINVSSMGHKFVNKEGIQFDKINQDTRYKYGQSKLANILHSNELARRLKEEGIPITANSVHPGSVVTNLMREGRFLHGLINMVGKYMFKSIQQGAATTCYVALNQQVKGVSGEYFSDCNVAKASSLANAQDLAKKLWDFSLNLIDPK